MHPSLLIGLVAIGIFYMMMRSFLFFLIGSIVCVLREARTRHA